MAFGDSRPDREDREPREPPKLNLDPHWSEALAAISHHCGLMTDHLENQYAKILRNKNDERKDQEDFEVPSAKGSILPGVRAAKSITIRHEPGKLFKIKVVIIEYPGKEIYFVGNTSARHFFDEGCGEETTDDGKRFPDRRANANCHLLLRCDPDADPKIKPCCDYFRRCIKKKDNLCKWEEAVYNNDPYRKRKEENNAFNDNSSPVDGGFSPDDGFPTEDKNGFGGDGAGDAGGWGGADEDTTMGGTGGDTSTW